MRTFNPSSLPFRKGGVGGFESYFVSNYWFWLFGYWVMGAYLEFGYWNFVRCG
jgi:hypothetical protein